MFRSGFSKLLSPVTVSCIYRIYSSKTDKYSYCNVLTSATQADFRLCKPQRQIPHAVMLKSVCAAFLAFKYVSSDNLKVRIMELILFK